MKQVIAHVDMDCFFAACEEKKNPTLKGKPVIIGASPRDKRGVVSTANYEARKFGVHSAMPISKAYSLCPQGIYIKGNSKLYKENSILAMNALKIFASRFEQVSIDEAYLDITEFVKECENLEEAGKRIINEVFNATQLTCSIGISESRSVSKIASDFKKPFGITVVNDAKSFLKDLSISKIPGIGKKTSEKMFSLGISTIGQLANAEIFFLLDNFGKHIIKYQEIAKGNNYSGVSSREKKRKSASREITFSEDIELEKCREYIIELGNKILKDISKSTFKTISIKVRYGDFKTITRDFSLKTPANDLNQIYYFTNKLLDEITDKRKIRLFGIKVSNLEHLKSKQMKLECFCCN